MTDRIKGIEVALEKEIRIDDAEGLLQSIKMLRGVADVRPVINTHDDFMNRRMIQHQMERRLSRALAWDRKNEEC